MPQAWLWFPDKQSRDAAMATFASLAAARGLTWSELCRALADGELTLTE